MKIYKVLFYVAELSAITSASLMPGASRVMKLMRGTIGVFRG